MKCDLERRGQRTASRDFNVILNATQRSPQAEDHNHPANQSVSQPSSLNCPSFPITDTGSGDAPISQAGTGLHHWRSLTPFTPTLKKRIFQLSMFVPDMVTF